MGHPSIASTPTKSACVNLFTFSRLPPPLFFYLNPPTFTPLPHTRFILSGDDMGVVCQWGVAPLSGEGGGSSSSSSKQPPPPLLAKYSSSSSAPIPLSTATSSSSSSSSKSGGVPCTSIGIVAGVAGVAGYADGRVRVYMLGSGGAAEGSTTTATASATTGRFLEGEAGGHSGAVTGLALHPRLPAFATCGQDGVVCVWSLPELAGVKAGMGGGGGGGASGAGGPKSTGKLVLDFCHRVSKTAVLTGVGFAPAPGNSSNAYHLLATSYDTLTLTVFLSL